MMHAYYLSFFPNSKIEILIFENRFKLNWLRLIGMNATDIVLKLDT